MISLSLHFFSSSENIGILPSINKIYNRMKKLLSEVGPYVVHEITGCASVEWTESYAFELIVCVCLPCLQHFFLFNEKWSNLDLHKTNDL